MVTVKPMHRITATDEYPHIDATANANAARYCIKRHLTAFPFIALNDAAEPNYFLLAPLVAPPLPAPLPAPLDAPPFEAPLLEAALVAPLLVAALEAPALEAPALEAPALEAPALEAPALEAPPLAAVPLEAPPLLAALGGAALVVGFIGLAAGFAALAVDDLTGVVLAAVALAAAGFVAGLASGFFDVAMILPPEIFATIATYRFIILQIAICKVRDCFHCNVALSKLQ
jgi:hypothetical protein